MHEALKLDAVLSQLGLLVPASITHHARLFPPGISPSNCAERSRFMPWRAYLTGYYFYHPFHPFFCSLRWSLDWNQWRLDECHSMTDPQTLRSPLAGTAPDSLTRDGADMDGPLT